MLGCGKAEDTLPLSEADSRKTPARQSMVARSLDLLKEKGATIERAEPNGPVVGIRLVGSTDDPTDISPKMLVGLADLSSLRRLCLANVKMQKASMKALGRLSQLRQLHLLGRGFVYRRDARASGDVLSGLHGLRSLNIVNPHCFVKGGLNLAGLRSLRHLTLSRGRLKIPAQPARSLPELESILLWGSAIEEEGWVRLGKLPKLKWFSFGYNDLTNHAVKALSTSKTLEDVTLWPCPGNEPNSIAYRELAKLPRLRRLHVYKSGITGGRPELSAETAKALGQVPGLTTLGVTMLSPGTVHHFRNIRELSLRETRPEVNQELAKLPGLRRLRVRVEKEPELAGLERLVQLSELTVKYAQGIGEGQLTREAIWDALSVAWPEHVRVRIVAE